jgi:CDGSH-type Zn-finger protein
MVDMAPLDPDGPVTITPYRDGPLIVRGDVRIQDADGQPIGVDRAVIALCRCGRSRIRPFCDGTHKLSRFRAPAGRESDQEPSQDMRPG